MRLSLATALRSITGPYRSDNQDSLGSSTDYVFVADGVGGHVGGDVASWTITHRLMASLATVATQRLTEEALRELVAVANAELRLRGDREPALAGMSTTLTGVFCGDDTVRVVHIGDSRAYLVRDGVGRRMTRDDSLVQLLLDQGTIDDAEAAFHPHRNIILHSLSGDLDDAASLTVHVVPASPGDRWLVCSDGLTDYVDEAEILRLLAMGTVEEAADALVAAALEAETHDNVSVGVAEVVLAQDDARPYRCLGAAAAPEVGEAADLSG